LFRRLLLATWAAALGACSGDSSKSSVATDGLRVALLTPGPISDQAWNGSAYAGLTRVRDSLGAQVSHVQVRTPADFEENFRQYGSAGYSLIIGHGFEFQDVAARVAPSYPKSFYVTTGGSTTGPNLGTLSFSFDEPSFLAGMIAGAATRTGVIGSVGGTDLPPVHKSFDAFREGAQFVRPDIRVITTFIGNWDDAGAGKEQALALMGRRADIIFQNADAAGLGVFQAVRERPGTLVIGANANQNALVPGGVLGSVVIDIPHAFLLLARRVKDGTAKGEVISFSTTDDVVRWEPSDPIVKARVPAAVLARVDSVQRAMRQGTFTASTSPTVVGARP